MTDTSPPPEVPPSQQPPPQSPVQQPVKPDLTMAWLPHLLMVLTWWLGPLIIWLVKKDEDKFAAFHGKQAMVQGIFATVVLIVAIILSLLLTVITVGVLAFTFPCFLSLIWLAHVVYGIVATVQTSQGKPFKYFFVADKFCSKEFAEAYPDLASGQPAAGQ
ncbi:MAG: DUF4870 domain-containing protein [Planctomycetota bacterium]|nr:DUF4870 domain-containing protein [Planctomycetota bacterium]